MDTYNGDFPIRFSVVIPAYNEEASIEDCLESVLSQTVRPDRIIVVDDGSTDGTADILSRYEDRLTVIHIRENTGNKALALREAIPFLEGEVVVYTDADSVLHPRAFERMLVHFLDGEVGGVSGFVRSRKHNVVTGMRELQYEFGQRVLKSGMAAMNAVPVIPGCVGAVRREFFDPSPDTITEDTDLTFSITERGYKVVYETGAEVWTSDPPNLRSYIRQGMRWYSGYFQNVRKHFGSLPGRMKLQMLVSVIDNSLFSLLLLGILASQMLLGDVKILLSLFLMEIAIWMVVAVHSALRMGRRDLFRSAVVSPLFRMVDSALWLYSLVGEVVLKRGDMTWHRSDRLAREREIVAGSLSQSQSR